MDRNELFVKYKDAVCAVAIANADENGEASIWKAEDMIRSICQVRLGEIEDKSGYKGLPEDFPCEEYLHDFYGVAVHTCAELKEVNNNENEL